MLFCANYYNYDGGAIYLPEKIKTEKLNSKTACEISRFFFERGCFKGKPIGIFSDLLCESGRDKKQSSCR